MKRQLLALASLFAGTFALAQSQPTFGIKAGLTSASIKGDAANSFNSLVDYSGGAFTTQSKMGFYGGVDANIPLTDQLSLQPGLLYSQKGYQLKGELSIKGAEFVSPNAKATLTSHYIDMPVLLKGNFNGFEVFAGPQVSYLAKADLKTTAGVLGFNLYKNTFDATEQLNRWDAGITGGVGYQFSNGVNISASYDHGLMKADANQNMDAYNRSFKVGLGFRF